MLFKSIRWKLTGTYLILILLTISVLTMAFVYPMQRFYLSFVDDTLTAQSQLIGQLVAENAWDQTLQPKVTQWAKDVSLRITVVDRLGNVLADSHEQPGQMENHRNRPEIKQALSGTVGQATRFSTTLNRKLKYIAVPVYQNAQLAGVARIAMPVSDVYAILNQIKGILAAAVLLAVLVGVIISLRLSATLTRPVEEITTVAGKIAEGKFNERFYPRTDDEIAVLGRTVNYMAEILKEKVAEIEQNRANLETILDNMVSGVLVLNAHGNIEMVNQAARRELGIEDPVIGRHNLEVIRNHKLNEQIKGVLQSRTVASFEINLLPGRNRVFVVHLAPVESGGDSMRVIAVLHDITQLRQLEQMRKDFVANVSHELKTPLTSISGFVETMLDDQDMDVATRDKFLRIMDKETARLNSLIDDLLELSRIESGRAYNEQNAVDLAEVAKEVVEEMRPRAERKGLVLGTQLEHALAVNGSGSGLAQVVLNLLDNAIKYTAEGGSINVAGWTEQGKVYLTVTDTGMGIPQEEKERIFERFYRVDKARSRKLGGTGLGLAIVKHILENHHGSIGVSSSFNGGTEFRVILPAGVA